MNKVELLSLLRSTIKEEELLLYRANDRIFEEGENSSGAYLILSGEIKLVKKNRRGQEILIDRIGPNELIGGMSLLNDNWVRPTTAIVFTDVSQIIKISKEHFNNEIQTMSLTTRLLISTLGERLLKSYKRILHLG